MSRPRSIAAAVAAGTDLDALGCAAHEVGHGVAFHAAGIRVRHMRIRSVRVDWHGVCEPVAAGRWIPDALVPGWQVGLMAGEAALANFLARHTDLPRWRAREIAAASTRHDLPDFHKVSGPGAISLAEARSRAAALVARHEDRIDRLVLRLALDHELPGSAL